MNEATPLFPSATSGRSRRLRSSAVAVVIGLLLALVLVASLSATRSPSALESDGDHDSMLIPPALYRVRMWWRFRYSLFFPVEEHLAKNIYAMSGKSYFPTNPKVVTKSMTPSRTLPILMPLHAYILNLCFSS